MCCVTHDYCNYRGRCSDYPTTLRHRGAASNGESREPDEGKPQGRSMQECPLKRAWSRCA